LPSLTAGLTGVIGSMLATVLTVLGGICGPVAFLIYRRYVGVLGAGARTKGSPARLAYDALRESLSEGNIATRLYARWLTAFLGAVDRFFGDAGLADRTLFPRAFGLKTPAPLWTAPAFDRCLLLALIYPVVTIFAIWAITGHVGPAEAALRLDPGLPGWRRGLAVAAFGLAVFTTWHSKRTLHLWKSLAWMQGLFIFALAFSLANGGATNVYFATNFALAAAFAAAFALGIVHASAASGVVVVFGITISFVFTISGLDVYRTVFAAIFVFVAALVVIATLIISSKMHRWHGVYLSFFVPVMIMVCLATVSFLSPLENAGSFGPVLLFLGLLTLLNAPFDWASLGLTRALLRRGLELAGWWPYLLALVDAVLAAVIVAALAITMVIGVQAFDGLAVHGGGEPVLRLDALLDGIAGHPAEPEYWWLYALLLSSMIPSLINLMIGGASLLRGLPGLPSLILRFMPVGKAVPAFDRAWIALVLTLQIVVGAILGVAAQILLVVGVIGYVMPWLGLGLLDLARDVAAFNLPLRIGQLLTGIF
jgi:hypothetical protein